MNEHSDTALVLGATGGIGGEVASQLREAGWLVRGLHRGAVKLGASSAGIDWVQGDAMNREDVMQAAQGCAAIVHAVNPPGYRDWGRLVLPMLDNTVAAAIAQHATIVLPGTVYNYGPDAYAHWLREDAPQQPMTRKGAIRVQMEQRLHAAASHGARVLIVRAGDFFGPRPGNSWFSQAMVRPGQAVTRIRNPADSGAGHQWAYLPDVARTMVALLDKRASLDAFECFHMAGHWDADGLQMAHAIQRVVQRHTGRLPRITGGQWGMMRLAAPFVPLLRELLEMRYLWCQPVRMANNKLLQVLGHEPHTPLDAAVEASLTALGCLDAQPAGLAGAVR